jgi:NitT/TauT family transport system ATP-binding protein
MLSRPPMAPTHSSLDRADQINQRILLSGIEKRYATNDGEIHALTQMDLSVRNGEFLVVLGPSGCGKTTLIRLIAGLVKPSMGTIRIGGHDLWIDGQRNAMAIQDVGLVFQEANLFPWYTVQENVALPLKVKGNSRPERLRRAAELAELVGVKGFEKCWPKELSGGMRQRVALARALACGPKILLMDEPFGALDALTRDTMNVELQRICQASACTVVFVTHSMMEAVFLADRVIAFSPRPGHIDYETEIPFPRPRSLDIQTTSPFQAIVRELRLRLRQ